ncbi:uncharacterized protein LOC133722821 [Rosa rugosa]|uniref:uncharacterized protein LOC133722821 n=1 Tax=Rosa rugosa TaxID=74645 RepID=UPI002B417121|nr:uncharacterized protein LOC133722821 [Rosa rugosa]
MNLHKRKVLHNPLCSICGEYPETIEHCLLLCPWTSAVWFGGPTGYSPNKQSITSLDAWLLEVDKRVNSLSGDRAYVFQLVTHQLWEIWKHRCEIVVAHGSPNPIGTIERTRRSFGDWLHAVNSKLCPPARISSSQSLNSNWYPPDPTTFKVNVDGAWDAYSKKSGIGIVVRNHRGNSIAGASIYSAHNSAIETEAAGVVKGLQLAAYLKIQSIVLKCDCQEIIAVLDNPSLTPNWRILPMINMITQLKTLFPGIIWNWVPRTANRVADAAAKLAKLRLCSLEWANRPSASLLSVLRSDGLPGPLVV